MAVPCEQIEDIVARLRAAAEANLQTPSRHGNVIHLDETNSSEIVVVADLHGNRLNFEHMLGIADLSNNPLRHLVMQEVCHGGPTYPSGGGCMSHLLLEDVGALKVRYPQQFHFLLSNHELAELTDFPIMKGGRMLNLVFRSGLKELYGAGSESVRLACLDFLRTCPLGIKLASGVFICHSAPEGSDRESFDAGIFQRPLAHEDYEPYGPVFQLVWGRDFREKNAEAFAKLVQAQVLVHGHEPCPEGCRVPNRWQVIVDSCCDRASYVVIPTTGNVSQQDVIDRIRRL